MKDSSKKPVKGTKKPGKTPAEGGSDPESAKNGGPSAARRFALNDFTGVRKAMARLAKEYDAGQLSEQKYRAFTYGLRGLLAAIEAERNDESEQRLSAIERRLDEVEKLKGGMNAH